MQIDIPDEWIKDCFNIPRDTSMEEAIKMIMSNINRKYFVYALGERVLDEIILKS